MKWYSGLSSFAIVCTIAILLLCSCSSRRGDADQTSNSRSRATTTPLFTSADPVVKNQIRNLLSGYFNLNQALINDNLAAAKTAAADLLATSDKFGMSKLTGEQLDFYFIQSSKLKTGLVVIRSSTDIEQARTGLADVSEALYTVVKAFRANKSPLYYQYCPMARNNQGAAWLSATEELVNPYMGHMMLNCGRTQEKLE